MVKDIKLKNIGVPLKKNKVGQCLKITDTGLPLYLYCLVENHKMRGLNIFLKFAMSCKTSTQLDNF